MFGLRDIEIVAEIVRAGGFRAAAQRHGLSQSAISARIAQLERNLGFLIFDRVNRRVRLTAAGRRFLEAAESLVAARDRIVYQLQQDESLVGTVRVGVAESIVHTVLSDMLTALHEAHPNVRFELSVDISEQLSIKLRDDEIDVAIMLRELAPKAASTAPLKRIKLGWYAAASLTLPKRPLSVADLAAHQIVTFPKASPPYREVEHIFADPDIVPPLLHGSASLSTVIHLVASGFGIGVLPCRMVEASPLGAQLKALRVQKAAMPSELQFAVAYLPERNETVGRLITAAALTADKIDHNN
jgi:DNA-binding transcriptional LysR family regulator